MGLPVFDNDLYNIFHEHRFSNKLAGACYYQWFDTHGYVVTNDEWWKVGPGDDPATLMATKWDKPAQVVKIGRCLRSVVTKAYLPHIPSADIEQMANAIKAWQEARANAWHLIRGDEIAEVYRNGGPRSCMAGKPARRFALYTRNPDTVGMLVYRDPNGAVGARALVWTATDGHTYVDRAYGSDSMRVAVANEAQKRGWYKRTHDDYDYEHTEEWTAPSGERETRFVTVALAAGSDYEEYPYCDTFHLLDTTDDTLCNLRITTEGEDYDDETTLLLRHTNGQPANRYTCASCGDVSYTATEGAYVEEVWYCTGCADDMLCADCGYRYPDLTEGYCGNCLHRHTCSACGDVEFYTYESDTGARYCNVCANERRCTGCNRVVEERDEDGMCRRCAPRCTDCQARIEQEMGWPLYCERCREAHTCVTCRTTLRPYVILHDGECSGCRRSHTCDECGTTVPREEIVRLEAIRRGWRTGTWTRRCRACEHDRIRHMVARIAARQGG